MESSITSGAVSQGSGIGNWYDDVVELSDPSNIEKSLFESGLDFEYGLTPLYNKDGKEISRNKKLITLQKHSNLIGPNRRSYDGQIRMAYPDTMIPQDSRDVYFKDHNRRLEWNRDNPDKPQLELIKRTSENNYLSIVGSDYKIHQPRAFYEIFLKLAEHYRLELTMAGVVQDGKKIFARIKLDHDIRVLDAKIANYLLLVTGVGVSTKGGLNPWDLDCFNAWMQLLSSTQWDLGNVSHKNTLPSIHFAQAMLQKMDIPQQQKELTALATASCSPNERKEYFKNVLFPPRRGGFGSWDRLEAFPASDHSEDNQRKREHLQLKNQETLERYIEVANDDSKAKVNCDARNNTWYGSFQEAIWIADRFNVNNHSELGSARVNSTLLGKIRNTKQHCYDFALNREAVQLRYAA